MADNLSDGGAMSASPGTKVMFVGPCDSNEMRESSRIAEYNNNIFNHVMTILNAFGIDESDLDKDMQQNLRVYLSSRIVASSGCNSQCVSVDLITTLMTTILDVACNHKFFDGAMPSMPFSHIFKLFLFLTVAGRISNPDKDDNFFESLSSYAYIVYVYIHNCAAKGADIKHTIKISYGIDTVTVDFIHDTNIAFKLCNTIKYKHNKHMSSILRILSNFMEMKTSSGDNDIQHLFNFTVRVTV